MIKRIVAILLICAMMLTVTSCKSIVKTPADDNRVYYVDEEGHTQYVEKDGDGKYYITDGEGVTTYIEDEKYLNQEYDIVIFTHDHMDHTDPETYPVILNKENHKVVLAPFSSWNIVRQLKGNNNFVMFNEGTTWTEGNLKFTSVKAEHSDPTPIGVIIEDNDKKYYVTGDTLYNEEIFGDIPKDIYALFLPVNG